MTYTHGHADAVLRSHRWRDATNSAAYLLPHIAAGQRLLDVGCGPGTITVDLARRVAPGAVIGLDVESAVLEEARAHAAEAGLTNVDFRTGDVYRLTEEFGEASFDVVHAHQVLQHLAQPVEALRQMAAVCRPGGIVAARDSDYSAFAWYPGDPRLDRWLKLYRDVARANGGEPDAGRRLRSWAQEAGYSEVICGASAWCFATDDDRAWWSDLWAERVSATRLGQRAVELGLASGDELHEIAAAWRRWAAQPGAWFAVLHGEVLCRP
jgi:2-polyprenyl-3-methyl-5-hydroxy-6-metoxy-1,4-benzoquinol methylase